MESIDERDPLDFAARSTEGWNDGCIKAVVSKIPPKDAESALYCEDCGDRIPDARREAVPGCQSCRDCAEINEMANSR